MMSLQIETNIINGYCAGQDQMPFMDYLRVADMIIAVSYFAIPLEMLYFGSKNQVKPNFITWLFVAFILSCGLTHLFQVFFNPVTMIWVLGILKWLTAIVSSITAVAMLKAVPKIVGLENKINQFLEENDKKLFQTNPLRNDIIPKFIPINMKSLLYLLDFPKLTSSEKNSLLRSVISDSSNSGDLSYLEKKVWNKYFKMDKKYMNQNGYSFYNRIDTDGIGCSITFIKTEYRRKVVKPKMKLDQNPYELISDLSLKQLEELKKRTLIGLDPGKAILAMLVDEEGNHLKYTSRQRSFESYKDGAEKVRNEMREKFQLQKTECILSDHNSKTMDVNRFKFFIFIKSRVNNELREQYSKIIYRKLRLRSFIRGRRSIDNFLNEIERKFGKDVVIGYGNWSRASQMKHLPPSLGRGLRREIHRRFLTLSIDEFGTSKYCNLCGDELAHFKKLYRLLVCEGRHSSESEGGVKKFMNRDINGALNILKCFVEWVYHQRRPEYLKRERSKEDSSFDGCESEKFPVLDHFCEEMEKP